MDQNRREFVKFLALIAAGAAAMPQQIEAFEKYYDANTPASGLDFVAVDDIIIAGLGVRSLPLECDFYKGDKKVMTFGVNLFGGIMRWAATPDQKIITAGERDFYWRLRPTIEERFRSVAEDMRAQISFVNAKYQRKTVFLTKLEGSLAEP